MRKAETALEAAQLLYDNGFADDACKRAYYAMFDAARAVLLVSHAPVEAEIARTHRGLIAAFGQHIVRPGRASAALGKALNRAHEVRLIADYSGVSVNLDQAAELMAQASTFVAAAQGLLEDLENSSD